MSETLDDLSQLAQLLDEYVRTHVTFRPVKAELCACGKHLRWTVAPVFHDEPIPPPDMSKYVTGDGEPPRHGTVAPNDATD
jgi:hypothetical protein